MSECAEYQLPEVMDREASSLVREKLMDLIGPAEQVLLNASQVARLTTAGVQVLVSLKVQANEEKWTVVISQPSATFVEVVRGLGLIKFLDVVE
jgi:anti-anti-sigma regulatory factor